MKRDKMDEMVIASVTLATLSNDLEELSRNNIPGTHLFLVSGGDDEGIIALYDSESDEVVTRYDTCEDSILDICLDVLSKIKN